MATKTNKERLATIENEIIHINKGLKDLNQSQKDCSKKVGTRLEDVEDAIQNKLSGSLSPKDKTQIRIARISGISGIVIAMIACIGTYAFR